MLVFFLSHTVIQGVDCELGLLSQCVLVMLQPQNYPEEQKNHRSGQNGEREPSQGKFKGASFEINKQMGGKDDEEHGGTYPE